LLGYQESMRILFTGATSFTGMWFAKALAADGHSVIAAVRQPLAAYADLRAQRLEKLKGSCEFVWGAPFGSPQFLDMIRQAGPFDLLCHHAAEVKDYRSPDFDVDAAVAANCQSLPSVLTTLRKDGCQRLVLTGSVFEPDEGSGTEPLRAFSPYGHSKALTAQLFRRESEKQGFAMGKFVIPNPFGPYEEPRFTEYLMKSWSSGQTPRINTPDYVRDNVPVTLLSAAYGQFAAAIPGNGFHKLNPSFYAESQGAFAKRFAGEISRRLEIAAPLELADQTDFPEPLVRINTCPLKGPDLGWSESDFWDETADYYAERFAIPARRYA